MERATIVSLCCAAPVLLLPFTRVIESIHCISELTEFLIVPWRVIGEVGAAGSSGTVKV